MRHRCTPLLLLLALPLLAAQARAALTYSVSWLGNSFPGAEKWVQQDIHALCVAADGTVYTNAGWDEGGREVGIYKDGDVIGRAGHTHGRGFNGGEAIALNGRYV